MKISKEGPAPILKISREGIFDRAYRRDQGRPKARHKDR